MAAYSFLDVSCSIAGVGGAFTFSGGIAEEGITIEAAADKNVMTIGADGAGMHSLVASTAATATIRLLKTNPQNAQLQAMYNLQTSSSASHGSNVIMVRDAVRGDIVTLVQAAFKKQPSLGWAKEGGTLEWTFDALRSVPILGSGTPEIN